VKREECAAVWGKDCGGKRETIPLINGSIYTSVILN
jgi:hypothetical protein